jgi:hypothetical protein
MESYGLDQGRRVVSSKEEKVYFNPNVMGEIGEVGLNSRNVDVI